MHHADFRRQPGRSGLTASGEKHRHPVAQMAQDRTDQVHGGAVTVLDIVHRHQNGPVGGKVPEQEQHRPLHGRMGRAVTAPASR